MKSSMKGILLMGVLFSFVFTYAQEKKSLTLTEAIELSIKNSKELKISVAKIDEAVAAVKEAMEKRLPDVSIAGSYLRIITGTFDLKTKTSGSSSGAGLPTVNDAVYGMLNTSIPVYNGGKTKYGIESSKFLAQAASLDAENNRDEVIQNTIEAFANLFKAKSAVDLVKENLLQSQQRTKDFSDLEKNGLLPRNDLLKAELQSSNIELNLLDAENNLQLSNINMDLMLGLPATTEIVLDTTGNEKKNDSRTLEDYLQVAMKNRKDLSALDYRKKAAEAGVKIAHGDMYPSLKLTGGYIEADIPKFLSITNAMNAGIGISYNIGSLWKTKAKEQQAAARLKQLVITESMADDNIQLEVSKSYLTLLSSRKKIEVYAKAVEQAEENYRIVKNKFDNSLATATDLLEADVAQFQARLSYTLSRADAFVAYNKMLQTAGILSDDLKKADKN